MCKQHTAIGKCVALSSEWRLVIAIEKEINWWQLNSRQNINEKKKNDEKNENNNHFKSHKHFKL